MKTKAISPPKRSSNVRSKIPDLFEADKCSRANSWQFVKNDPPVRTWQSDNPHTGRHGYGRNQNQNQKASSGGNGTWCIAKPSTENTKLDGNINYICTQNGIDCKPIQPSGTCYRPKTTISHASYAMNLFYRAAGKNTWNCHFNGTGIIISVNPSIGSCNYPI